MIFKPLTWRGFTMRWRKGRGKKKPVVTMTEGDIVEACNKWLTDKGIRTGDICWMKINTAKVVKRRGRRVEFVSEVIQ